MEFCLPFCLALCYNGLYWFKCTKHKLHSTINLGSALFNWDITLSLTECIPLQWLCKKQKDFHTQKTKFDIDLISLTQTPYYNCSMFFFCLEQRMWTLSYFLKVYSS